MRRVGGCFAANSRCDGFARPVSSAIHISLIQLWQANVDTGLEVMNPTITARYENNQTRTLAKIIELADAARSKANAYIRDAVDAKEKHTQATIMFLGTLNPEHGCELARLSAEARAAAELATVIEDHGGPAGARIRALSRSEVYDLLYEAFKNREAEIKGLGGPIRKLLARRRAELTEEGVSGLLIEVDPEVVRLRSALSAIDDAWRAALCNANYCEQKPTRYDRTFDQLYAELTAPLPSAPELATA